MMKRVQKHIDSNVTAADEVLQQSEEVVAKTEAKEPEIKQVTNDKSDEKSKKKKRKNKKNKKSKQSFFKMLRMEWKSISKPKPKELAVATVRTVVISVISAGVISGFDFGVTQIMVQLAKLIG